jgi:tetratricopeptide (TPR) repeat protein
MHAYYGRWLEQHGRSAEAVAQLQTAVMLDPPRLLQHELLIETFTRSGDLSGAQRAAQDTLAIVPDDAVAQQTLLHPPVRDAAFWINLSLDQYRQAQYQQSLQSAREALQLDPNSAEAYVNIGAGYGAMGQWDEAIRNERQALRLKPDLQLAKNNLAWYLHQSSISHTKTAPVTAADLVNESLLLNEAGKYSESIAAARRALQLDPRSAEAWNNIAANNEAMHRWDDAIAAARKAISLQPGFQLAKSNLAWSLSQKALGR